MFDGPFRPLSDPMTQHCLYDIMEGYFPSELQATFPDGVPFKVSEQTLINIILNFENSHHSSSSLIL